MNNKSATFTNGPTVVKIEIFADSLFFEEKVYGETYTLVTGRDDMPSSEELFGILNPDKGEPKSFVLGNNDLDAIVSPSLNEVCFSNSDGHGTVSIDYSAVYWLAENL